MRVYLAGPDVFLPDAMAIGAAKGALCRAAGLEPLYPLEAELELDWETTPKPVLAQALFDSNCALIRRADAVLANLTPFRGPSADAGTVWEVGFAHALGKPVFGYSNLTAPFAERSRAFLAVRPDGLQVEDFALPSDNLMIHFALAAYFAEQASDIWRDLGSFQQALAALRARV